MKINGKRVLNVALPVVGILLISSGVQACANKQLDREKNDRCAIIAKDPKLVYEFKNAESRTKAIREYETEYYVNAIITGDESAFIEGTAPIKSVNCLDYSKKEKVKANSLPIKKINNRY